MKMTNMFMKVIKTIWAFIVLVPLISNNVRFVVHCQLVNPPPYFIPGTGDMSRFSLPENTPIDSPVYQLKGISVKYSFHLHHFSFEIESQIKHIFFYYRVKKKIVRFGIFD